MSEYDGTQASTKRGANRQTGEKNGMQPTVPQRPASDDKDEWKAYWKQQGQPWRTEPEIDLSGKAHFRIVALSHLISKRVFIPSKMSNKNWEN